MQSDVIRTQVYVPQAAFGVATGVDAVVRVPEIPDRTFPGKVTRFAHVKAGDEVFSSRRLPSPTAARCSRRRRRCRRLSDNDLVCQA